MSRSPFVRLHVASTLVAAALAIACLDQLGGVATWVGDWSFKLATDRVERALAGPAAAAWAGDYDNGFGASVSLEPSAGFVVETHSCAGAFNAGMGDVAEHDGVIELHSTDRSLLRRWIPSHLYAVHWRDQRYLLRDGDVVGFCNAVNSDRAQAWMFLSRDAPGGPREPTLPAAATWCLRARAIVATAAAAGPAAWQIRLDVGTRDGAFRGMELHACTGEAVATVTDAGPERSQANLIDYARPPAKALGRRFTTRLPCPSST